jgi:hypothetical protein
MHLDVIVKEIAAIVNHYRIPMTLQDVGDLLIGKFQAQDISAAAWAGFDEGDLLLTVDRKISTPQIEKGDTHGSL